MPAKKSEEVVCAASEDKTFLLKNLLDKAEALGYSKFIAVGAFYGVSEDTEMTKASFIETIETYRKRRVV